MRSTDERNISSILQIQLNVCTSNGYSCYLTEKIWKKSKMWPRSKEKREIKVQRGKGNKSPKRKGKIKVQRKKGNRSSKRKGK